MNTPPYVDAPTPDMVLLDLNLPRTLGIDVLREARTYARCDAVRFVILTTSDSLADRERCLASGADEYLTKSSDFDAYVQAAKSACGVLTKSAAG